MAVCLIHSSQDSYGNEISPAVFGCIEEARDGQIKGWVFSPSGETILFQLVLNGAAVEHQVVWCERPDVAEKYGASARQSGFTIQVQGPDPVFTNAETCRQAGLRVLANDVSLRWFGEGGARNGARSIAAVQKLLGSNLDAVDRFVARGWAIPQNGDGSDITVRINGRELACPVAKVERKDVSQAYGVPAENVGFEALLPGCMWELCDGDEHCSVEVFVNGVMVAKRPATVHKAHLVEWVTHAAEEQNPETRELLALLALEHVKYAGLYSSLPDEARGFIDATLHATGLEGYIPEASPFHDEPARETVGKLALRNAMYELNGLLATDSGGVYEHIKAVYERHGLRGVAKEWYLNLAIQLACDKGEFERLYELTDFRYLDALKSSRQPHQLALLLPILVSQGNVEQATGLVRSIAKNINKSWLQTECLAYAVGYVRQLELGREIDIQTAEGFRNAFVAVLDGMRNEWFSRLHDRRLVETVVNMLGELALYTDYHGRSLVAAAIRHYGLSPLFWELKRSTSVVFCPDEELKRAERAWEAVHTLVMCEGTIAEEALLDGFDALDYFAEKGNREADGFAGEILARFMAETGNAVEGLSRETQRRVARCFATDRLRFAAHPSRLTELADCCGVDDSSELVRLQRSMTDHQRSALSALQRYASAAVNKMYEAQLHAEHSHQVMADRLATVEKLATLLGSPQGMYLGVDLLLNAYFLGTRCGYLPPSILMRAGEMIREAIDQSTAKTGIPSPIVSVLSRLSAERTDPNLQSLISEMRDLMQAKFGNAYEMLFDAEESAPIVPERYFYCDDTLLLIDIKRDDVDTRASEIRDTWLKKAKERGIPYLFVVCGKEERVNGDILELAVAERLELRTWKTLKMFDWAARHSQAQYVIKVDAGCYIDIERYFDSLSYRKFHYYGKVVRCSGQKMSRTWHQAGADSEVVQKSLDKSPGNSVFADGTLAYSMSRFALLKLAAVMRTDKAKRLVAVSLAEDKLIGDLLALARLKPSDEDFDAYSGGYAVHEVLPEQVKGNPFLPGKNTLCKIVGKNKSMSLQQLERFREEQEVWPKKIWPTFVMPSLKANGNQLELLSDREALAQLLGQDVVVVSVVRNEMTLLPQFLEHYRKLGVRCFIFVDNCSEDGSREFLLSQPDAIVYTTNTEYRNSHYGVSWQQAVLGNHCLGKWVLLADADEFLVYQDCENVGLSEFLRQPDSQNANGVLLYMIDMYPYGNLQDARFEGNDVFAVAPYFDRKPLIELRFGRGMYSNSRNFVNGLRHRIAPSRINAYVSQKYALFKYYPWVRMSEGVHYAANMTVAQTPAFFAHFKYHSGFKEKVELEVRRKQHFNGAEEYNKYAGMMAEITGGFGVEDVSEKYEGSHSFVRLLDTLD